MQSKSSKIQTRPIEDLLGRIRTLRQKGEREIRIPANEADKLADSLSQVMTRMVTIQEEIIDALKTAKEAQTINIEMDGGNFDDKK
jgi:aspartate/glutamate racemase